ncbi:MAG: winged helix-turn-helix transcriptional regulator [Promethearchaeota archaeon]
MTTEKESKELPLEQEAECSRTSINGVCLCPLEGIIHTVSRKWTLQIITLIGNHERLRYGDLQKLCVGISPTVLSERLKSLEEEGIISRKVFAEIPPRVEYSLTEDGTGLRESIVPLMNWASKRCA